MKIDLNKLTFGSDFEMLVENINTGEIIPCPVEFGGTKETPLSIGDSGYGECFRQIDGVAAEFNIPVVNTLEAWVKSYEYCIAKGNEILNAMGLRLIAKTSHVFKSEQFVEPRHTEFGCNVSYCAYDWETLHPDSSQAGNMRTTGAHIHMGFPMTDDFGGLFVQRLMYCMDKCVGIPALELDTNTERRNLYGKAGEYRDKFIKDGEEVERNDAVNGNPVDVIILEYRCLGGLIVNSSDFMFKATNKAIKLFNSDYMFTEEEINSQRNKINHEEYITV